MKTVPLLLCKVASIVSVIGAVFVIPAITATEPEQVERIVLFRHGEKPVDGLGQLNCQGLNRALALPTVLVDRFGTPQYLFAPNPSHRKPDRGNTYDYIRPLATIEPTAIRLGMPVNTQYGFDEVDKLQTALLAPALIASNIWIAWEHKEIVNFEHTLLKQLNSDPSMVPAWDDNDFDRIDVVDIRRAASGMISVAYHREQEGLNGRPSECPR
jgi:hypothetical protein